MTRYCLDSWAVLRWLEGEKPASGRVDEVLPDRPVMSWINVAEVFYITTRSAGPGVARDIVRDLRAMLDLDLPSIDRVLHAASIKADYAMSLADAFAVATAVDSNAILMTGDPEITAADRPWEVEDLRGSG